MQHLSGYLGNFAEAKVYSVMCCWKPNVIMKCRLSMADVDISFNDRASFIGLMVADYILRF